MAVALDQRPQLLCPCSIAINGNNVMKGIEYLLITTSKNASLTPCLNLGPRPISRGIRIIRPLLSLTQCQNHVRGFSACGHGPKRSLNGHCKSLTSTANTNTTRKHGCRYLSTQVEQPQDEAIQAYRVQVVRSDGTLGEPISLQDALKARNVDEGGRRVDLLRQVSPPDQSRIYPICKYVNIKEDRERSVSMKKTARAHKTHTKQLALNWTIGVNDLEHRIRRLEGFLEKGNQVEVVLGSMQRRGWMRKRPDDLETARALVKKIRDAALSVEGAKEKQKMQGILGQDQEICLIFEGPKPTDKA